MAIKRRKFVEGIRLKGSTNATALEGEIRLDPSALKFKAYVDGAERSVVTEDQAQTLENKTIDATAASGNNTLSADSVDIVYDDTSEAVSSLGTDVQSALDAVKVALDNQNEASEIDYDNSTSGLAATDVQAAIDEVEGRVDTVETSASDNATAISDHLTDAVDAHDASAISNVPAGNLAATDVQGALDELQSDVDTRALADSGTITNASIQTPSRLDTKQDTEANLITYATSATDGQFVFATDTQKMYQIIDNELAAVGGGGATAFEINQVAHGFAVGEGVYHNGSTWVKAQADDADTLAYFAIVEVIDVDNFIAADFGRIEVPTHGYTVGEFYFQSDSVAGQATNVEPSSFSNPLFYVEDANTLQVKVYRPAVVGQDVTLDQLSDVSAPSPTDGQALIYDNGNSRWEAKDIATSAADITYDNSTSGLTATDSQAAIDEVEGRVDTLEAATVALDDLSDVSVASPNDGEVLTYNSGSGDWESVKAPSSQINYIENNDFEVDTSGWTGDTNLVISRITSGQLRGDASLQIAKGAVDASTEQVYVDFTIDSADLAKKLVISFDIDASDANYSDDDMKVKIIKDPSGTPVDISVNGQEIKGGKFQYIGQFQTDATELDYRLVIEQVSTQASAVNIVIDNVSVGPREVAIGPTVQDWSEYQTITIGANTTAPSKGNPSVDRIRYRRVGDSVDLEFSYTQTDNSGASAGSGNYYIELPDGLEWDSLYNGSDNVIGYGMLHSSGGVEIPVAFQKGNPNRIYVAVVNNSGSNLQYFFSYWSSTKFQLTGTVVNLYGSISGAKIQGWSANTQMSEDLGGREVVVEGAGNGGTSITANVTDIDFTEVRDTTSSWNGSVFTAPETGEYDIEGMIRITASLSPLVSVYINGVRKVSAGYDATAGTYEKFSCSLGLNKGDELSFRSDTSLVLQNNLQDHWIHIVKLASPQTILETETVAARYTSNSGQSIANNSSGPVIYEDVVKDTHNAYNVSTGEYTIPTSGWYDVKAMVTYSALSVAAGDQVRMAIVNNLVTVQFERHTMQGTSTAIQSFKVADTYYFEKGDSVTIEAFQNTGAAEALTTSAVENTFSIIRIK